MRTLAVLNVGLLNLESYAPISGKLANTIHHIIRGSGWAHCIFPHNKGCSFRLILTFAAGTYCPCSRQYKVDPVVAENQMDVFISNRLINEKRKRQRDAYKPSCSSTGTYLGGLVPPECSGSGWAGKGLHLPTITVRNELAKGQGAAPPIYIDEANKQGQEEMHEYVLVRGKVDRKHRC